MLLRRLLPTIVCLIASLNVEAIAQTNIPPEFDAASIKPSAPDARGTVIAMPPGGRVEIGNMTLKEMIEDAYRIQAFQISGGPSWLDSDHFDISAKAGVDLKRDDVLLMLQSLLADRFRLVFRREVRTLPVTNWYWHERTESSDRGLSKPRKAAARSPIRSIRLQSIPCAYVATLCRARAS